MLTSTITVLLAAVAAPFAAACPGHPPSTSNIEARSENNGPCVGDGGAPGVCVPTAECTKAGGKYISNACAGLPKDVRCCTKPSCGSGNAGNCRFTSSCDSGKTEANQCPGPSSFKCCMPGGSGGGGGGGGGGYPTPSLPTLGSGCKQTAINGAKKIIDQFPGKVIEIGCKRTCSDGSDHCIGMANDLMVAAYGARTTEGEAIAEWVMNNRAALSLKYVMWGQHIWSPGRDSVGPWSGWRDQSPKDRGGNTANHWDHVHVSYA